MRKFLILTLAVLGGGLLHIARAEYLQGEYVPMTIAIFVAAAFVVSAGRLLEDLY